MKKTIFFLAFLSFLLPLPSWASEYQDKVKTIKHDISFLNLLNGLAFSDDQMTKLISRMEEAAQVNMEFDKKYEAAYWEVQDQYNKLRKVLMQNNGIPQEMEMLTYKLDGRLHELDTERAAAITAIEDKVVSEILTPRQCKVIEDFTECVIPPNSLKNPERVGQMPDNEEYAVMLDKLRKMSDDEYASSVDTEIAAMLKHIDVHHCILTADEKKAETSKYKKAFEKSRKLTFADYMLQRDALAAEINYDNVDHKWWVRKVEGQPGEVAMYLLDSSNMEILKQRLAMARLDDRKIIVEKMPQSK